MGDASARIPDKQFTESIYNVNTDYEDQPFVKGEKFGVHKEIPQDNVGNLIDQHEQKRNPQSRPRPMTAFATRPSSEVKSQASYYYGGYDKPMPGRRDSHGYFNGRFKTSEEVQDEVKLAQGAQMIYNSIQKVAGHLTHSRSQQLIEQEDQVERDQKKLWEADNFYQTRGEGKSFRLNGYAAGKRPQSALANYQNRGLTKAQSTPFIEPGVGYLADNNTFNDFETKVSEQTNKLKRNIYGNKYGYYSNRPLTALNRRKEPLVISKAGPKKSINGRNLAISKDLKNYYEEKNFKDTLYFDSRIQEVPNRQGTNKLIEGLVRYRKTIEGQPQIFNGLLKLKESELLKQKDNKITSIKHWPTKAYIYNDYHDKTTKDGYARNALGTFYYR